jgi:hypothetical protein
MLFTLKNKKAKEPKLKSSSVLNQVLTKQASLWLWELCKMSRAGKGSVFKDTRFLKRL